MVIKTDLWNKDSARQINKIFNQPNSQTKGGYSCLKLHLRIEVLVAWIVVLAASLLALLVCRLKQHNLCGSVDGEFFCTIYWYFLYR